MATEQIKIGLLVGRENTFPGAFIAKVNELGREHNIIAEMCSLGGTRMDEPTPYRVIVDRISHEIPYYRAYLKKAALDGCVVVNNPFWWSADDKFFECALATKLGVAVPKTVVLPQKSYVEGVVSDSLKNLKYPMPWDEIVAYIGLPAFLKPFIGGGWKNVYKVHSVEELIWAFDQTGQLGMILQEGIRWDKYVRCYCLGQDNIMPIRYEPDNPFHERYVYDPEFLESELAARVVHDAQVLNRALGFDMNTCEFAIRDGVPYAIDFLNVAPDMDFYSVGEYYFDWVVNNMARLVIKRALENNQPGPVYRWDALLNSTPAPTGAPNGLVQPNSSRPGFENAPNWNLTPPEGLSWIYQPYNIPGGAGAIYYGGGEEHEAEQGAGHIPEDQVSEVPLAKPAGGSETTP